MCSLIKATITGSFETRVKCLVKDKIFQLGRMLDPSPVKFTHHGVSPFVWETLLSKICCLKAHIHKIHVTVVVQLLVVHVSIDITHLFDDIT